MADVSNELIQTYAQLNDFLNKNVGTADFIEAFQSAQDSSSLLSDWDILPIGNILGGYVESSNGFLGMFVENKTDPSQFALITSNVAEITPGSVPDLVLQADSFSLLTSTGAQWIDAETYFYQHKILPVIQNLQSQQPSSWGSGPTNVTLTGWSTGGFAAQGAAINLNLLLGTGGVNVNSVTFNQVGLWNYLREKGIDPADVANTSSLYKNYIVNSDLLPSLFPQVGEIHYVNDVVNNLLLSNLGLPDGYDQVLEATGAKGFIEQLNKFFVLGEEALPAIAKIVALSNHSLLAFSSGNFSETDAGLIYNVAEKLVWPAEKGLTQGFDKAIDFLLNRFSENQGSAASYAIETSDGQIHLPLATSAQSAVNLVLSINSDVTITQVGISGTSNDDVVHALDSYNNNLVGGDGNDSLVGGSGVDDLDGGNGNDTLTGGAGDGDILRGGFGDDTYLFNIGNGNDFIQEGSPIAGQLNLSGGDDTLILGAGITPGDITFANSHGDDLVLSLLNTATDSITIQDQFSNASIGAHIEHIKFQDSPELSVTLVGTNDNTELDGTSGNDVLYSLAGNDSLLGLGGNDFLNGGDGADLLDGGSGSDTLMGENGNDTLIGGVGDDSLNGGAGDDSLNGSTGNDVLLGGLGNDTLIGGTGDDHLIGGQGDDLYLFNRGDGSDSIQDMVQVNVVGGNDTLKFGTGITRQDIQRIVEGSDLILKLKNSTDQVRIVNQYDPTTSNSQIENIQYADGSSSLMGEDTIQSAGHTTTTFINHGSGIFNPGFDTPSLDKTGGYSYSGANGSANSTFIARIVNDQGIGSIINQGYYVNGDSTVQAENFNLTGGDDYIIGDSSGVGDFYVTSNQLVNWTPDPEMNGDPMMGGFYTYTVDDVQGTYIGGDDIILADASGSNLLGDGILNFGKAVASTGYPDDFVNNASVNIIFKGGDDSLVGNVGNDKLTGDGNITASSITAGNDTLIGGAGNDLLLGDGDLTRLNDQTPITWGDDSLDGGSGNDYLVGDGANYNNVPYWGFGTDQVVKSFDLGGNDTLAGGTGNDTLNGGIGNDTYIFNRGDGQDLIIEKLNGGGGADTVQFGAGITQSDVSYSANVTAAGVDLVISINGTTDKLTIQQQLNDQRSGSGHQDVGFRVENFAFSDGTVLTSQQIQQTFATAALIVTGTADNDYMLGSGINQRMAGLQGSDNIKGASLGDTLDGGEGNDTIDAGTGLDTLVGGTGDDFFIINSAGVVVQENANEGNDTLSIGKNLSELNFQLNGSDLVISDQGVVIATVSNELTSAGDFAVESFNFASGETLSAIQVLPAGPAISGSTGDDNLIGTALSESIQGLAGNDTLNGLAGNDTLDGGDGNDTYVFSNAWGQDSIVDSAGSDTVSLSAVSDNLQINLASSSNQVMDYSNGSGISWNTANTTIEAVVSGSGNDYLQGNADNNLLNGAGGNDTLDGGSGTDTLVGGTGDDQYYVASGGTTIVENANAGEDTLNLSIGNGPGDFTFQASSNNLDILFNNQVFATVLNQLATDGAKVEHFVFNTGSSLSAADVQALLPAAIDPDETLNGSDGNDTLTGGSGNDRLDGSAGDDLLNGQAGNDNLIGWTGNDTMLGGAGNDTLDAGDGADSLDGGSGSDLLYGRLGNDTLLGGDGNDTLDGGENEDSLVGGAGDDSLIGWTGNDTLLGGDGADTLDGGDGADSLDGGSGNDQLYGRLGNDTILGGDGNDTVDGGEEDDSLDGGSGNDRLIGWTGNDTLLGGDGQDTLDGGDGNDSLSGGTGDDILLAWTGNDTLLGGDGNDSLDASDGDDVLNGGSGNDTLIGGIGNDTYQFSAGFGNDTVIDTAGQDSMVFGAGYDSTDVLFAVNSSDDLIIRFNGNTSDQVTIQQQFRTNPPEQNQQIETFSFADGVTYTAAQVQALLQVVGTSGNDTLEGSALSEVMNGLAGDDALYGRQGNDTLMGGDGNDTLDAGEGDDALDGGSGDDRLIGYTGNDTLLGGDGNDTLDGGDGDDSLVGGAGADNLIGWTGNDTLLGGDGADTLDGGDGADSLDGGSGNDQLYGRQGNDTILGGDGNDTVDGGEDQDSLDGGSGDDLLIGYTGNDTLFGSDGNDTLDGGDGDDSLLGGSGNDSLIGWTGNDTLNGGAGNDTLLGGDGNDTYTGFTTTSGVDVIDDASGTNDTANFAGYTTSQATWSAVDSNQDGNLDSLNVLLSTGNSVTVNNYFDNSAATVTGSHAGSGAIEHLIFDNNATVDFAGVQALLAPASENTTLDLSSHTNQLNVDLSQPPVAGQAALNLNSTADGSSSIQDYFNNTWTTVGNAAVGSTNSWKSGEKYVAFDGNGDFIRTNSVGMTGDSFTLHWKQEFTSLNSFQVMAGGVSDGSIVLGVYNSKPVIYIGSTGTGWNILSEVSGPTTIQTNHWYDMELSYSNTAGYKVFVDGNLELSTADTRQFYNAAGGFVMGANVHGDYSVNGQIADVYLTNSEQMHTQNFTPLTQPILDTVSQNAPWSGSIQNVIGGSGDDHLTGTTGANMLTGNAGNDTLAGGSGNDTLDGGAGNNTYRFANGWGADSIAADAGTGTLDFSAVTTNLAINLTASGTDEVSDGTNTLNWTGDLIANAVGGSGNDTITGSTGDNVLQGGAGNDSIVAGAGNDTLQGGVGNDTYTGFTNTSGMDVINDSSGSNDTASFAGYTTSQSTWSAVDSNQDGHVDSLNVLLSTGNSVTVNNYFDNSGTTAASSHAGTGAIEQLVFDNNATVDFAAVQALLAPVSVNNTLDLSAYSTNVHVDLSQPDGSGQAALNINQSADGSTTIPDYFNNTWTTAGNATIGSTNSWKTGEKYVAFSGSGGDLIKTTSTGLDSNQFTVHWKQNFTSLNTFQVMAAGVTDSSIALGVYNDKLVIYIGSTGSSWDIMSEVSGFTDIQTNHWYDIELTYSNTTGYKVFLDGVQELGTTNTTPFYNAAGGLVLGSNIHGSFTENGAISDFYMTKNAVMHTDNFTPSTMPIIDTVSQNVPWSGSIQNVIGGSGNDQLTGTTGDNILSGGSGNDTLNGDAGNDTLNGGAGNDSLLGGAGNDTYRNISGADTITDASGTSDTINFAGYNASQVSWSAWDSNQDGHLDQLMINLGSGNSVRIDNYFNDTAASPTSSSAGTGLIESLVFDNTSLSFANVQALINLDMLLIGTSGNDALEGGDGNDYLEGLDGNDVLTGNEGNDTLLGGNGNDNLNDNGGGGDLALPSNDYLDGGSGNDSLFAGAGNDTLIGGTGNDVLHGNEGNDLYIFNLGDGTDVMKEDNNISNPGNDTIQLGTGIDTAHTTFSGSGVDLQITVDSDGSLGANAPQNMITVQQGLEGSSSGFVTADSHHVENYQFLQDGTVYSYSDIVSRLESQGSNTDDYLTGASYYSNKEYGYAGNDLLVGGWVNDTLYGGAGNDELQGTNGNDLLVGGAGNDSLEGGVDNDTYLFNQGDGHDTVIDDAGTDTVQLGSSISESNVALFQTSNGNLQIGYTNSSGDVITIQSQTNSANAIERFELSTGNYMTVADVNSIISQMAAYATNNGMSYSSLGDVESNSNLMTIVNSGWHA